MRFLFFYLLFFFFASVPCTAASLFAEKPKPLTGETLIDVLTGNSIQGETNGIPFMQYFSTTGDTILKYESGEKELGQWRVDKNGKICTLWDGVVQSCYIGFQETPNTIRWMGPITIEGSERRISSITTLHRGNITGVAPPSPEKNRAVNFSYEKPIGNGIRQFLLN